jgi:hypothetical protein
VALLDSLISHWKFDESSGVRADSHGGNNLSEQAGSFGSMPGKLGDAGWSTGSGAVRRNHEIPSSIRNYRR